MSTFNDPSASTSLDNKDETLRELVDKYNACKLAYEKERNKNLALINLVMKIDRTTRAYYPVTPDLVREIRLFCLKYDKEVYNANIG